MGIRSRTASSSFLRKGNCRNPIKQSFHRGSHRTGIQYIRSHVIAAVYPGKYNIRLLWQKILYPHLHTIGGSSVHTVCFHSGDREIFFFHMQASPNGYTMGHGAALMSGSHHPYLTQLCRHSGKPADSIGLNSIVVYHHYPHRPLLFIVRSADTSVFIHNISCRSDESFSSGNS